MPTICIHGSSTRHKSQTVLWGWANYDQPGLHILQGYLLLHPTALFGFLLCTSIIFTIHKVWSVVPGIMSGLLFTAGIICIILWWQRLHCAWCRWVQGECASLGDMDAPEVDPRLHRAAEALREQQVLFRYCAEEVATARHNAMFQRYNSNNNNL